MQILAVKLRRLAIRFGVSILKLMCNDMHFSLKKIILATIALVRTRLL